MTVTKAEHVLAKTMLMLGRSHPTGMLVEIILSQTLTVILAGLVVAAVLQ